MHRGGKKGGLWGKKQYRLDGRKRDRGFTGKERIKLEESRANSYKEAEAKNTKSDPILEANKTKRKGEGK